MRHRYLAKVAYTTYIRPMLEYATPVWSPSQIYLINTIESVQKQFTKRLPGLKNLTYEERLKLLGLQSLVHRRFNFRSSFVLQHHPRPFCHTT